MWAGCQVGTKPCSKYFTRDQNKYQVYTFGKHFLKNTETREQRRKVFCKIFFIYCPFILHYFLLFLAFSPYHFSNGRFISET